MKVWIVWENINDYPENGGGEYVSEIFLNELDAIDYCTQKNCDMNISEETTFEVRPWEVKESKNDWKPIYDGGHVIKKGE